MGLEKDKVDYNCHSHCSFTLGDANIEKMQFGVDQLMMLHDSQIM